MAIDRRFSGLLLMLAVLLPGCGQKWTAFEFENASSDETIVVDKLGPLDDPPPGGTLAPGQFAGGHMGVQQVPKKLSVVWRVVEAIPKSLEIPEEPHWTETEVDISNFDTFPRHEHVSLKYLGDGKWEAAFVEPE
jgi:hypothetical protein